MKSTTATSRHTEAKQKALHILTTTFLLLLLLLTFNTFLHHHPPPSFLPWTATTATSPSPLPNATKGPPAKERRCDLFRGEWVPDRDAPYYTNETCLTIREKQNCMKYGKPDLGFLKWSWKPYGCELPRFDPVAFLELVKGKSMAFVGDSLARNHMQSMICLLTRASRPILLYKIEDEHFIKYFFPNHNFTVAIFWSPFLIRADSTGPDDDFDGAFHLHLDKPDSRWTDDIESFDYVIISAGQWFFRPSYFYKRNKLVGCYRCRNNSILPTTFEFGFRRAFRTAFNYVNNLPNHAGGTIFLRTYSPSHFENGEWNKGGDCVRTRPFKRNRVSLEDYVLPLYAIPIEEFKVAKEEGETSGLKYHLLDITSMMQLRPDGHPSRYGHPTNATVPMYRDCVHWCLPGAIDSWSDLLLEILRGD